MTHKTSAPLRHWAGNIVYGSGMLALVFVAGALVMFMPKPGYDLPTGERAAPRTTIIYATGKTLHFGAETHPMALAVRDGLATCDVVALTCKPFSEPLTFETEDAGIVVANTENTY